MAKSVFTDAYADFLRALIAARKEAGVTQLELARRLGKVQPWISNVERGERRIDVIEFYAIARALKRDPAELFADVTSGLPKRVSI
jgi:transcriptional regulator with XRE-family HTH domain